MPNKNTFSPYSLSKDNRQTFTVNGFFGVDYNQAELQVAQNHAVELQNFLFKDKVNQKRFGWEELARSEEGAINGAWNYNGVIVAHIGEKLYKVSGLEKFLTTTFEEIGEGLENYKSQAFYSNGKLYILGGTKYFVLRDDFSLKAVEDDEDTYVPTTTIGITYADSPVGGATPLDDVNMMTEWRKNKLVSGTYFDDGVSLRTTRYWDWQLDTNIKSKETNDLNNIEVYVQFAIPRQNEEE